MNTFYLWCRYIAIQLVSLPLMIVGIPLIAIQLRLNRVVYERRWWEAERLLGWHFKDKWMFVWDNAEDGIVPPGHPFTRKAAFMWSALRNPANGLRGISGVSVPGGPYKLYTYKGFYCHFGFRPVEGSPVLSCGRL